MTEAQNQLPLLEGPTATESSKKGDEPAVVQPADHRLVDLLAEFRFFTPALLVTHGLWDRDPVAEFIQDNPGPGSYIKAIDFTLGPLFQGLGKKSIPVLHKRRKKELVDWDRRLYMVPTEWLPLLQNWLEGCVMCSQPHKYYCRPFSFDLTVLDLPAIKLKPVLPESVPSVPIRAFGFSTLAASYWLTTPVPIVQFRGELPEPVKMRPFREAVIEGRQLLGLPPLEESEHVPHVH